MIQAPRISHPNRRKIISRPIRCSCQVGAAGLRVALAVCITSLMPAGPVFALAAGLEANNAAAARSIPQSAGAVPLHLKTSDHPISLPARPEALANQRLQPDTRMIAEAESEIELRGDRPPAADPQTNLEDAIEQLQRQRDAVEDSDPSQIDPEFNLYRLGPGDAFFVNVQQFPEASFQATLDLQGNVIVPVVGILQLQGLTLETARDVIQEQLARYFVNPTVDLTLVAQRPVQVTIMGEVVRPGLYPLADPQLALALFTAGGATSLANLETVQVRRTLRNPNGQVVEVVEQNVDLFTPLAEGALLPNVRLADGDVIIVPALTPEDAVDYDRNLVARSNLGQATITIRVLNRAAGIGSLALPNGSDFIDAITAISPDQATSKLREVALIRYDPETGGVIRQEFNARRALSGDLSQNPILEDNDVIVIGRNLIGRITTALTTFTQPFRDILGFLLFFDTIGQSAETLFQPEGGDDDN